MEAPNPSQHGEQSATGQSMTFSSAPAQAPASPYEKDIAMIKKDQDSAAVSSCLTVFARLWRAQGNAGSPDFLWVAERATVRWTDIMGLSLAPRNRLTLPWLSDAILDVLLRAEPAGDATIQYMPTTFFRTLNLDKGQQLRFQSGKDVTTVLGAYLLNNNH
jgi:hypothetical protein